MDNDVIRQDSLRVLERSRRRRTLQTIVCRPTDQLATGHPSPGKRGIWSVLPISQSPCGSCHKSHSACRIFQIRNWEVGLAFVTARFQQFGPGALLHWLRATLTQRGFCWTVCPGSKLLGLPDHRALISTYTCLGPQFTHNPLILDACVQLLASISELVRQGDSYGTYGWLAAPRPAGHEPHLRAARIGGRKTR
jgi:hypothetical protein